MSSVDIPYLYVSVHIHLKGDFFREQSDCEMKYQVKEVFIKNHPNCGME